MRFRSIVRPLRTTFSTSLGNKNHLHNVIVQVVLDDGRLGIGEIPTSFTYPDESLDAIRTTLGQARRKLKGMEIGDYGERIKLFRHDFPRARMTVSGLEVALFRAWLRKKGTSERDHWGRGTARIETDITIPVLRDGEQLKRWIQWAIGKGFAAYKLKVSGDSAVDRLLLSTVYGALKERVGDFRLRLDGNQGYTVGSYLELVDHIEKMGYEIELFEQPLRKDDFRGFEEIRGRGRIPVVLDESVKDLESAKRVVDNGLGDGINVKIAKSGIGESVQIVDLARKCGMRLMIGCMTETMVGLSAGMFLALGKGAFDWVDLDSVHLLYGRNAYPGVEVKGPVIAIAE
jgi:L-Ala-D/L-Glu epimerase